MVGGDGEMERWREFCGEVWEFVVGCWEILSYGEEVRNCNVVVD